LLFTLLTGKLAGMSSDSVQNGRSSDQLLGRFRRLGWIRWLVVALAGAFAVDATAKYFRAESEAMSRRRDAASMENEFQIKTRETANKLTVESGDIYGFERTLENARGLARNSPLGEKVRAANEAASVAEMARHRRAVEFYLAAILTCATAIVAIVARPN
jgi:hypothetical protein